MSSPKKLSFYSDPHLSRCPSHRGQLQRRTTTNTRTLDLMSASCARLRRPECKVENAEPRGVGGRTGARAPAPSLPGCVTPGQTTSSVCLRGPTGEVPACTKDCRPLPRGQARWRAPGLTREQNKDPAPCRSHSSRGNRRYINRNT